MPLEQVPLTLATYAEGKLMRAANDAFTEVVERFRKDEDGEIELDGDVAEITLKLKMRRDPSAGGFVCSFKEPALKLPAIVSEGTVAVERDGVLVVTTEATPQQVRFPRTGTQE